MTKKQLELTIELAYNAFKAIFSVDIAGWGFFIVDDNKSPLNRKIMASYDDELDMIFINPYIAEIIIDAGLPDYMVIPTIFSKVGHEFRHAWQKRQKDYEDDFENRILLIEDEDKYRHQRIEVDAFAFEEVILKAMTGDKNMVLDIEDGDDVHELAMKLYDEYKNIVEKEIKNVMNLI